MPLAAAVGKADEIARPRRGTYSKLDLPPASSYIMARAEGDSPSTAQAAARGLVRSTAFSKPIWVLPPTP